MKNFTPLLLLVCFAQNAFADSADSADAPTASPIYSVVRAWFDDRAQVDALARERAPWKVDHKKGFIIIDGNPAQIESLRQLGFRVEVDEHLTQLHSLPPQPLRGQVSGIPGYPCYRTVEETYASAAALAAAYPDLAQWSDIGDSWEKASGRGGYDINALVLGNRATGGEKPVLMVTSAVHAREYTTAELNTRFAEFLLSAYGVDPDVTWVLDHNEIHLILQSNPDGRKNAETGLSWRKNTNQNYCGAGSSARGADLNRNFPFLWGCCGGSSGNQCSETYRGPFASSENETQAIADYARSIFGDQREDDLADAAPDDTSGIYIDVHSFSELVLWPWGFGEQVAPNGIAMQTLGRKFAWFNGYFPEQAIGLYPTDGTTDDFAYGELGIPSYTFELGTTFFQDCGTFENRILPDNLEALMFAARAARSPYLSPAGPDTAQVGILPAAIAEGEPVSLTALADDSRFSSAKGTEPVQDVAAAEYYLDVPPWSVDATPQPVSLAAADGAFDSPVESLQASIPTAGLTLGRHTVFLRAQDDSGRWGTVSAGFIHVLDPATAPRIEGNVSAIDSGVALQATVVAGARFGVENDPASGAYSLLLPAGTYDLVATPASDAYAPATVQGVIAQDTQIVTANFQLFPYCELLIDDVESGNTLWNPESPWAITTETAASPTHSWSDSPGGNYGNNRSRSLTSPDFDLSGLDAVQLDFAHLCNTEAGYDYCQVETSSDGGQTWNIVASYDGDGVWENVSLRLSGLDGKAQARIRFRIDTDGSITDDGWHIDDLRLRASGPSCITLDTDEDGIGDGVDNCTLVANADQRDTNGDGFGNVCDPDLDDSGSVNFIDLAILKSLFFQSSDGDADLNGDGEVNFLDLGIMKEYFFSPPGPAGAGGGG